MSKRIDMTAATDIETHRAAAPDAHDSRFGRRRRRRSVASCPPAAPTRQYGIVVRSVVAGSSPGASPSVKASLAQMSRAPIGHGLSHPPPEPSDDGRNESLFLYDETDTTEIHISSNLGSNLSCEGERSLWSEALQSCFANKYDILFPDDVKSQSDKGPTECTSFLRSVISSLHSRRSLESRAPLEDIQKEDIECLCRVLGPNVPSLPMDHHHCTCYDESCIADYITSLLGLEDIASFLRDNAHQPPQSRRNDKCRKSLRLLVAQRVQNKSTGKDGSGDSLDSSRAVPPPHKQSLDVIAILPSSAKVPLISVTLLLDEYATVDSNTILEDALLRSCVKRLLVGRTLLHSKLPVEIRKEEFWLKSETLSFRTRLSVKVPRNHDERRGKLLEFLVLGIEYAGSQSRTSEFVDAQVQTLFVILPSTRIKFQPFKEKQETLHSENEQNQSISNEQNFTKMSSISSCTSQNLMLPHQHLLESLRSIVSFQSSQIQPPIPRCFLFSGPPGVGKTYSVKIAIDVANSWSGDSATDIHLLSLRGSELLGSSAGGNHATAAKELDKQFQLAANLCNASDDPPRENAQAVVVFLDECDALVSSDVVAAMLALILDKMEGVVGTDKNSSGWKRVVVVAATNRVDAIPGFLRRPGRLEKEVVVSPPNAQERFALLKNMLGTPGTPLEINEVDLHKVAEACVGYVAADLTALVRRAAIISMENRFRDQEKSLQFTLQGRLQISPKDLFSAMNDVGASCLRDAALSAPPKTTWDDIAGDAGGAKKALQEAIEWPRTRRKAFEALGLSPPRGVLLHGPPGCAKTTLARAAAGAAGVAFLSLSPADVYASSYVGEAEGIVRRAFDLARSAAPCVLFFDEIDAIIGGDDEGGSGKQGHGMGRGTSAEARVLSTFLNEMDGVDGSVKDGVLVLGATNRPGLLDAALLRPGRFDRVVYVPPPDALGRKSILEMECKKWRDALLAYASHSADTDAQPYAIGEYFDVDHLASEGVSGFMTGAEIVGACREVAIKVMRTLMQSNSEAFASPSKETAKNLMSSLEDALEASFRSKVPLLSDDQVLDEYTLFEDRQK
ncbi:hypothetical protein ACHAWF_006204 [Thalassiosira exigua]